MVAVQHPTHSAVQAVLKFSPPAVRHVFYATDREKSHMPFEEHTVSIGNVRPIVQELSIQKNGFVFLQQPTAAVDLYDGDQVKRHYLPEVESIIRNLTGAEKVLCFGEITRTDRPAASDGNQPARFAHVDYGARSVRDFTIELLGEEAAEHWLQRRHMLINVWRPISTVWRMPLALADASSIHASDLQDIEVHGGLGNPNRRTLYGFNLAYRSEQRWWYAPAMQRDELWAFKLFDSDPSQVQLTAHSAFIDPTSAPDAPPRESIEVRTISFMPQ